MYNNYDAFFLLLLSQYEGGIQNLISGKSRTDKNILRKNIFFNYFSFSAVTLISFANSDIV